MAPLVSIIVPCYNPGPMLKLCLTSCFAQTHPNVEIILVDNNSTDDSLASATEMARGQQHQLRVTKCEEQGISFARNRGFELAQGEYIQWLDADDEISPNKLARQAAALESAADADIAYCDWQWRFVKKNRPVSALNFGLRQYDDFLLRILANVWMPPHCYLLKREAANRLSALGQWRPEARPIEDREYYTLAAIIGLRFLYVPDCSVRYNRWSTSQVTHDYDHDARARQRTDNFAFLRSQADKEPASRFTAEHRWLLNQDWHRYKARKENLGADLDEAEKGILKVAAKAPEPYVIEDYASVITISLWEGLLRHSALKKAGAEKIRQALRQLLAMPTGLTADERAEAAQIAPPPIPKVAPILMKERLAVRRILERLAEKGSLVEVPS